MPVTPFHFGLGALPGGSISRWFSFRIFCLTNVIIDLESLYRILLGLYPIHQWGHTFIVSFVTATVLALPVSRPTCQYFTKYWNRNAVGSVLSSIRLKEKIGSVAAISGAMIGASSHVVLDAIMHSDVRPFMPFSDSNPFYGLVGILALHAILIASGLIGLIVFLVLTFKPIDGRRPLNRRDTK